MDKTLNKLKRAEGQIAAVRRMYEEGRECGEIAQQIMAVRSALSGVARDLLTNEAKECVKSRKRLADFDKILKSLFKQG